MTEEQQALACRAVACKHWRWMPGMLASEGSRITDVIKDQILTDTYDETMRRFCVLGSDSLPDLTDPATLGCLLALVREAWRSPLIHPRAEGCEWRMWKTEPYAYAYETEEEVLVAALEAAP